VAARGESPRDIKKTKKILSSNNLRCPDTAIRIRIQIPRYGDTTIFQKCGYGDTFVYIYILNINNIYKLLIFVRECELLLYIYETRSIGVPCDMVVCQKSLKTPEV
jgi:hypothetical protein